MLTVKRETSQFWFESHREVWVIEGSRYRDSTVKHKLLEASPVLFPNNQEIIFFKMRGLAFFFYSGCCSAMSSKILPKHFSGWGSPYQRLHVNSWRYSCKTLGFVFPFIRLNFSLAAFQLLSSLWVCLPIIGSTKLTLGFTVKCCRSSCLLAWL